MPPDDDNRRPVILVGYSMAWLRALSGFMPEKSVVVVEEPEVVRKRKIGPQLGDLPTLRELVECEYHLEGMADSFVNGHPDLHPIAVIPVVEYSVPFAARLAERYGTPGATYGAARLLRDKSLLRAVTAAAGIPNPRSVPVDGPDAVRAVLAEAGGAVVLKPANRQASVGIKIVYEPSEVDTAWAECAFQEEGAFFPDRPAPVRMLAERLLRGEEFSVEATVHGGRPVFAAVTRKFVFDGPRPVERGHLHPADIGEELRERLVADTARVLAAVGMDVGFVHCEWIVEDGVPHLVECAGRLPGDWIMDIIEAAWGYRLFRQYCGIMRGERPEAPPAAATGYAAVWMAHAAPGEVESVDGVEEAKAVDGVQSCLVSVEPGGRIHELRSSWDRVAAVIATGPTAAAALSAARQAIDRIAIKTRPTLTR